MALLKEEQAKARAEEHRLEKAQEERKIREVKRPHSVFTSKCLTVTSLHLKPPEPVFFYFSIVGSCAILVRHIYFRS